MTAFANDFAYSNRFIPAAKRIPLQHMGHLIEIALPELDCLRNCDLVLLHMGGKHIAMRVRRPGFAERYPNEVTFRLGRPNGIPTELDKIVAGEWHGHPYCHVFRSATRSPHIIWSTSIASAPCCFASQSCCTSRINVSTGRKPSPDSTWFFQVRLDRLPMDVLVPLNDEGAPRPPASLHSVRLATEQLALRWP